MLEKARRDSVSPDTTERMKDLAAIQTSLRKLQSYLVDQQSRIKSESAALAALQNRRSELEPIVQSQSRTVDAILAENAARQAQGVWWERMWGFIGGVLSSLMATGLLYASKVLNRQAKKTVFEKG